MIGISILGKVHKKKEICQDSFCCFSSLKNKVSALMVSDGAGSYSYSNYGSSILCAEIINKISLSEINLLKKNEWWIETIYKIRSLLEQKIIANQKLHIKEFSATLLGCVIFNEEKLVLTVHIGDGHIVGFEGDKGKILSLPENGEYAGETVFFTRENFEKHLRINIFPIGNLSSFFLFTDGIDPISIKNQKISNVFLPPLNKYLLNDQISDEIKYKAVNSKLIEAAQLGYCYDDMTLVWHKSNFMEFDTYESQFKKRYDYIPEENTYISTQDNKLKKLPKNIPEENVYMTAHWTIYLSLLCAIGSLCLLINGAFL